ncbi:MAG: hypothetical protein Q4B68_08245 [Bacteroidales bacterium]|nr:hypothetical protein [Bacteroidales bacterium]
MNNNQSPQPAAPAPAPQWEACVERMNLDEATGSRVREIIKRVECGEIDEATVNMLSRAVNHDEDVKNAETEGYLRGRNEKIEQVTHPMQEEEPECQPARFPRYNRRSVWNL